VREPVSCVDAKSALVVAPGDVAKISESARHSAIVPQSHALNMVGKPADNGEYPQLLRRQ
jgi:hypothetical protein